jgi:hypothetical protein
MTASSSTRTVPAIATERAAPGAGPRRQARRPGFIAGSRMPSSDPGPTRDAARVPERELERLLRRQTAYLRLTERRAPDACLVAGRLVVGAICLAPSNGVIVLTPFIAACIGCGTTFARFGLTHFLRLPEGRRRQEKGRQANCQSKAQDPSPPETYREAYSAPWAASIIPVR